MTATGTTRAQVPTVTWKGLTWVNIEGPTLAEMEFLKARFGFHPLALDDCLSRVQLPKVDEYDDHIFLVLHFPAVNQRTRMTLPSQVTIFAGVSYIVTVHKGDLRPLTKLFRDCQGSDVVRQEIMSRSSGYLLYRVLDALVDYCFPILNNVSENVDRVEENLFERAAGQVARDLSQIRRDIIAYRRIIRPQIGVMETLEQTEYSFLKLDPDVYFGDLADHTRRIWFELEEVKEVTEGLHDALFTLNTQLTNDVIRMLTIIFTATLPLTALSGLYGMNVPLPFSSTNWAFLFILALSFSVSTLMLLVFRLLRWI